MCLYPTLIKNRKYTANKKNGGNVPPITDERTKYVPIKCGDCIECRKAKAREWQIRLQEDIKVNKNAKFITLTFSNEAYTKIVNGVDDKGKPIKELEKIKELEGYTRDNAIAKAAVRLWTERWRKEYGTTIRHWLITELGHNGTENIHLHGIIWTDKTMNDVERHWKYGHVWKGKPTIVNGRKELINYVTERTVNYIIKYITKKDEIHTQYKSIMLCSKGIGGNYIKTTDSKHNKFNGTNTVETYRTGAGYKMAMPIYYRNKIYTEEEREKLWLQRLDEQTRYVCGEKIDISKGEEAYYKTLKFHQKRNKKLGYGDGTKNWEQEQYEIQRRNMQNEKRKAKESATSIDECSAPQGQSADAQVGVSTHTSQRNASHSHRVGIGYAPSPPQGEEPDNLSLTCQ